MAEYELTLARSARKELEALDEPFSSRVLKRIRSLAGRPRPEGCRKLQGTADLWRIRVGEYRVVYRVDDARKLIDVIVIRHRSAAYR